jgi:hypothetical protein
MVGGDCDDAAITCMACCLSIGIEPVWAVGASYKNPTDVPTHVYFGFADDFGKRVVADATIGLPVGSVHPAAREWWVNPVDGIDASSLAGGEFVGVAGAPGQGGVAMRDWSEVGIAGRRVRAFGLGDYVVSGTVAVLAQEVDGAMAATDAGIKACALMAASDVADWNGIYSGWQSWLTGFQSCQASMIPGWQTACSPYYDTFNGWQAANAALQAYNAQLQAWQGRIQTACPTFQPTPNIPIVQPAQNETTFGQDIAQAGKTILTVGVGGVVLYGIYKALQIAAKVA